MLVEDANYLSSTWRYEDLRVAVLGFKKGMAVREMRCTWWASGWECKYESSKKEYYKADRTVLGVVERGARGPN